MKYRIIEMISGNYIKNDQDKTLYLRKFQYAQNLADYSNEKFDGEYYVERVEDDTE